MYIDKEIAKLADIAKDICEGKTKIYELVASLTDEGVADFMGAASQAAADGKKEFEFGGKTYPVTIAKDVATKIDKKMDAEDDDDKDEEVEFEGLEETEDKKEYSPKSNDEIAPDTDTGVEGQDDVEKKDGEEEESEEPEVKKEAVEEVVEEDEEDVEESTLNYARTMKAIEKERKMKNISAQDKVTLGKIADLMKQLGESADGGCQCGKSQDSDGNCDGSHKS